MFELKTITRHAGTVLIGQLAVMAFGVTDTLVAGRYSESALATLSVGSAIYMSVYVGLMGVLQALLPVWAELHGGRRFAALGRSVRQALYLCAMVSVTGMVALLNPDQVMRWTQVPETLQAEVNHYLAVLALALPPSMLFRMYSTLNQALGKPALVTWLQAGSLLVKVPLSIWFAFGGFGLEPHGAVGCACRGGLWRASAPDNVYPQLRVTRAGEYSAECGPAKGPLPDREIRQETRSGNAHARKRGPYGPEGRRRSALRTPACRCAARELDGG